MISGFMTACGGKEADKTNNVTTASVPLSGKANTDDKITVTDSAGKKVEVPTRIERIADAWGAHNAVLSMLGFGDKIVATTLNPKLKPWLYKVTPGLDKAVTAFSVDASNINMEEIAKVKPDIAFMPSGNKSMDKFTEAGIPVVQVSFKNFDSLIKCVQLTGDILGDSGKEKANLYISYLSKKLAMVKGITKEIPEKDKPKVLHLADLSPLKVDGKDTIINSWIEAAGGINAAKDIGGNIQEVSVEQILKWNPDIIIVSSTVGNKDRKKSIDEILKSDTWGQLEAVKKHKVYINPDGAFSWDRYSAEEALQVQWAAKLIWPDKFKDISVENETKYFYKTFFNYDLSEKEVNRIINGQPPEN